MGSHNICLSKEVDKSTQTVSGRFRNCLSVLISVFVVIRLITVCDDTKKCIKLFRFSTCYGQSHA